MISRVVERSCREGRVCRVIARDNIRFRHFSLLLRPLEQNHAEHTSEDRSLGSGRPVAVADICRSGQQLELSLCVVQRPAPCEIDSFLSAVWSDNKQRSV